ncbi:hypothetical protein HS7_09670 [Sulfolobales archaeon HS-7]|nr:hypothetical protein HS7_09670 [Sulfolobales archaeon HS-7]
MLRGTMKLEEVTERTIYSRSLITDIPKMKRKERRDSKRVLSTLSANPFP